MSTADGQKPPIQDEYERRVSINPAHLVDGHSALLDVPLAHRDTERVQPNVTVACVRYSACLGYKPVIPALENGVVVVVSESMCPG